MDNKDTCTDLDALADALDKASEKAFDAQMQELAETVPGFDALIDQNEKAAEAFFKEFAESQNDTQKEVKP